MRHLSVLGRFAVELAKARAVWSRRRRALVGIEPDAQRHLSMLRILYGASAAALDAFKAADNPVDAELMADLERVVERTHGEIERLAVRFSNPS